MKNNHESGHDSKDGKEASSKSDDKHNKEEEKDDVGDECIENPPVLTVPVLPLMENHDASVQKGTANVCDGDIGDIIDYEDQPAVCNLPNVATQNVTHTVAGVSTSKEAAAFQGNELCLHALSLSHYS